MITIKSNNSHVIKGLCADCIFVAAKCAEDYIVECPYFAKEQYQYIEHRQCCGVGNFENGFYNDSEPIIVSRVEISPWRKVADQLPENNSRIYNKNTPQTIPYIVYNGVDVLVAKYFKNPGTGKDEFTYFHNHHDINPSVTHWMPLPEPPTGVK